MNPLKPFITVGISQQEDFTQWARLTRKRQALEKMAKTEAEKSAQNAQECSFRLPFVPCGAEKRKILTCAQ